MDSLAQLEQRCQDSSAVIDEHKAPTLCSSSTKTTPGDETTEDDVQEQTIFDDEAAFSFPAHDHCYLCNGMDGMEGFMSNEIVRPSARSGERDYMRRKRYLQSRYGRDVTDSFHEQDIPAPAYEIFMETLLPVDRMVLRKEEMLFRESAALLRLIRERADSSDASTHSESCDLSPYWNQ